MKEPTAMPADVPATVRSAITRLLHPQPLKAQPAPTVPARPAGWPGLYLGYGQTGPVHGGAEHHALILGPPRSGKTTRLATPNITNHPGPVVVTSTKTDIAAATYPARTRRGRCWLWDPTGRLPAPHDVVPLRWSPVVGCADWDTAVGRAHTLAGAARPAAPGHLGQSDIHWVERAQALLAPLLHAAALADGDMAVVCSWLHRRELLQPLALLQEHDARLAANVLDGIIATDGREQSGIFSTADGILAAYRTNSALQSARDPNFDPATFAASTDTIYLVAPGTAQALYAPLVVALLDQIRTATYQRHPVTPMLWALDELANIAPLPDLPATLAEGASQGVVLLACLQDLSQARHRWGPAADGFLTLFTHKIVLPGVADTTTLRAISALAGDIDVPYQSTSQAATPWPFARTEPTRSTSMHRLPALPPDAIATGRPGTALWLNRTTPRLVAVPSLRGVR